MVRQTVCSCSFDHDSIAVMSVSLNDAERTGEFIFAQFREQVFDSLIAFQKVPSAKNLNEL